METDKPEKALSLHPLRASERLRLELRLGDLLQFLGAPGDWGYDTELGDLTLYLLKVMARLNRSAPDSRGEG